MPVAPKSLEIFYKISRRHRGGMILESWIMLPAIFQQRLYRLSLAAQTSTTLAVRNTDKSHTQTAVSKQAIQGIHRQDIILVEIAEENCMMQVGKVAE